MKVTIFFSWQSQTHEKANRYFIINAIEKATKRITRKPAFKNIEYVILEGMNGEAGQKPLADTIIDERIPRCDVFIADLTIVNSLFGFQKFINKLFKFKHRPGHNNNVMYESGVARAHVGNERIIHIQNTYYGEPPSQDLENITFDLRHLRYPINYHLNPEQLQNKAEVEKALTDSLCDAIEKVTRVALVEQRKKHAPFLRWKQWADQFGKVEKFHSNSKVHEIESAVKSIKAKESIRVLGLSGIGKTRMLLEAYRPKTDDESVIRSCKVLYFNCDTNYNVAIDNLLQDIFEEKDEHVVILDNCSASIHRRISKLISQDESCISLISVNSNPEELLNDKISGTQYISIKQEELDSIVDNILAAEFSLLDEAILNKIKSFSQGIPMMAALLGKSLREGEQFVGKLDDRELMTKILGERATNTSDRNYLRAISLFKSVGYYDDKKTQIEFLAENTSITPNEGEKTIKVVRCYEVCKHYIDRSVIEQNGRYISVRPFPLAIYLAQEWLDPCTPERLTQVISDLSSLGASDRIDLINSICERMKYLGFMKNAVEIVNQLVGNDGPFSNAEVITTELGSRLFRSFVEVNPVAISNRMAALISSMSHEDLLEIKIVRRDFIWILEKTCFDKRTFDESAKALCKLSTAENENWANNATGVFASLFKIYLAGTEADFATRIQVIDWGIEKGGMYLQVMLRAIDNALDTWHFHRTLGAEKQGTRQLKDYEPTISEIQEYHRNIVARLQLMLENPETSDAACKILENKTRSINSTIGFKSIVEMYRRICNEKNFDWSEGKRALSYLLKYDDELLSEDARIDVYGILQSLNKSDFKSRYERISSPNYLDSDGILDSESASSEMKVLASEFRDSKLIWKQYFQIFTKGNYYSSFSFGRHLGEASGDADTLSYIHESFELLDYDSSHESFNPSVICGLFTTLSQHNKELLLEKARNSQHLIKFIPILLSSDSQIGQNIHSLYDLIEEYAASNWLKYFRHSNALLALEASEIIEFSEAITSKDSSTTVLREMFEVLFSISFNKKSIKNELLPEIKRILGLCFDRGDDLRLDAFKLSETIIPHLSMSEDDEFASKVSRWYLSNPECLHDDYAKMLYIVLFDKYFHCVWGDFSVQIVSPDFLKVHRIQRGLGARIGSHSNVEAVFSGDRIKRIIKNSKDCDDSAIIQIAKMIPIFNNNNTDYSIFSEPFEEILTSYGNRPSILDALHTNMETYTWIGSKISMCEAKINALQSIRGKFHNVTDEWITRYINSLTKEIIEEKRSEDEAKRWNMN